MAGAQADRACSVFDMKAAFKTAVKAALCCLPSAGLSVVNRFRLQQGRRGVPCAERLSHWPMAGVAIAGVVQRSLSTPMFAEE